MFKPNYCDNTHIRMYSMETVHRTNIKMHLVTFEPRTHSDGDDDDDHDNDDGWD